MSKKRQSDVPLHKLDDKNSMRAQEDDDSDRFGPPVEAGYGIKMADADTLAKRRKVRGRRQNILDVTLEGAEGKKLGLVFEKETEPPEVKSVKEGGLAAQATPRIEPKMTLHQVGDTPVEGMSHGDAISLIKAAGLPVRLLFKRAPGTGQGFKFPSFPAPAVAKTTGAGQQVIDITLQGEEGKKLGLVFEKETEPPEVKSVKEGGLAAQATPRIEPKMTLHQVGDTPVDDMSYADAISLIKAAGLPVRLLFKRVPGSAGGTGQGFKFPSFPAPAAPTASKPTFKFGVTASPTTAGVGAAPEFKFGIQTTSSAEETASAAE